MDTLKSIDWKPFLHSQSPYPFYTANFFATICLYYGVNALVRPRNGYEAVFDFYYPDVDSASASTSDAKGISSVKRVKQQQRGIDGITRIYGLKSLFVGCSILAAVALGHRDMVGVMLVGVGLMATGDGFVCKSAVGKGEWNHWGYAPVVALTGVILLGGFDALL